VIYRTPFEMRQFNWLISQVASISMPAAPTRVNRYDFRDLSLGRSRRPREPARPIERASHA